MVNCDLPLDVKLLYKCKAIETVVNKISNGSPITIEEQKTLTYTFGFFGERGIQELQKITQNLAEVTRKEILDRVQVLKDRNHLPISCAKLKFDYEICPEADCPGSITPIMHCCGEDPNVQLVEEIHLADLDATHLSRYVKTQVYISGVGDSLSIPFVIEVRCETQLTQMCSGCPYAAGKIVSINDFRNLLNEPYLTLEFVKISKEREQALLSKYLKRFFEEAKQCPLLEFKKYPKLQLVVKKEKAVTPLIVCPGIDEVTIQDIETRENLRKRVYLMGIKKSVARKGVLIGPCLKNPKTGELSILGIHFQPTEVNLESFSLTPEQRELLDIIMKRPEEELVEVVGSHVCRIFGRPDAVLANLIAYHTPLYIIWKGEKIPGWVQIVNYGDTTTGKRIPRMIRQFIGLGVYVIVETAGRTGLLYFIDQSAEGFILGFGELVLADQTLAIVDGYDRMDPEEKAEFRESYRQGFLKVRRVVSGTAPMRTRIITCENVKNPLNEYLYPCTSLLENYDIPSIARIDLAVPYRREDVPSEEIFKLPSEKPEWFQHFQQALTLNVLLAWSRTPEQIRFTREAESMILTKAKEMDEKYGVSRLPFVSKDFDKKLAKLSAGYAAWRHSYDENLNLIVTQEHVEHVVNLIDRVYSSEGMRLNQYVEIAKKRLTLSDEEYEEIKREIEEAIKEEILSLEPGRPPYPIMETIINELQIRGTATLSELQSAIMEDISTKPSQDTIRNRIMLFKKHRLVISTRDGYKLTAKGIDFLHRYRKEKHLLSSRETNQNAQVSEEQQQKFFLKESKVRSKS